MGCAPAPELHPWPRENTAGPQLRAAGTAPGAGPNSTEPLSRAFEPEGQPCRRIRGLSRLRGLLSPRTPAPGAKVTPWEAGRSLGRRRRVPHSPSSPAPRPHLVSSPSSSPFLIPSPPPTPPVFEVETAELFDYSGHSSCSSPSPSAPFAAGTPAWRVQVGRRRRPGGPAGPRGSGSGTGAPWRPAGAVLPAIAVALLR